MLFIEKFGSIRDLLMKQKVKVGDVVEYTIKYDIHGGWTKATGYVEKIDDPGEFVSVRLFQPHPIGGYDYIVVYIDNVKVLSK
jgi:hypothetical protein